MELDRDREFNEQFIPKLSQTRSTSGEAFARNLVSWKKEPLKVFCWREGFGGNGGVSFSSSFSR